MEPETTNLQRTLRTGQRDAEAFDAVLRETEDRERTERLALLIETPTADPGFGAGCGSAPTEIARLRRQVEILASFRAAVLRSKAWRLIQALRRPFGRAW